ncbi:MAG: segregation/condensation protein A [Patescibacteria group bacterium]
MPYKVKVHQFEGPLDLLLQLIEQQEMDISQVSLATVTEQYLDYLNTTSGIPTEELADFLVVAAKLLLIKSRILLPQLQLEEEEGTDLERQLRLYKEFADASKVIRKLIGKHLFLFARERPAVPVERVFSPPRTLTADKLRELFAGVLREIEPWVSLPTQVIARTISIRERITSLQEHISRMESVNFRDLLASAKNKTEIIVTFLALLELVKQRSVAVVQQHVFDDIVVKKVEGTDLSLG